MTSYAFAMPLVPGKTEAWRGYVKELTGPRSAEYKASRQRAGITKEHVFLQATPMGDFVVVAMECDDPATVIERLLASTDPFDVWFRDKVLIEAHGVDPSAPPPPMNETISLGP
jgi:hypothetical protein